MGSKRKLALSFLLAIIAVLLLGCGSILQPSQEKLVEASFFIEYEPVTLSIYTELILDDTVFYYDTVVVQDGPAAEWTGEATVYSWGTYFKQDCHTAITTGASHKEWRGIWAKSETELPSSQISSWLQDVFAGDGYYPKKPVIPASEESRLSDITYQCYKVILEDKNILWPAICDANIDSLFGGQSLLETYASGDVVLYFGVEDLELKAVTVSSERGNGIMRTTIQIERGGELSNVDITEGQVVEAPLSEEWSMLRFDFLEPTE